MTMKSLQPLLIPMTSKHTEFKYAENIEKIDPQEEEGQVIELDDAEEKEEKEEEDVQPESNENELYVGEVKKKEEEDDLSDYSASVKKRIAK